MAAHRLVVGGIVALACIAAPAQSSAQVVQRTHGPDPVSAITPTAHAAAGASEVDWCENTDPAANQFENGQYRYHAVYAYPADRPSRLAALGAELQGDAFGASALIEQEYGRAIRFDVGTPCGPGQLDISAVQLPFTADQLGALASATHTATFDAVAAALLWPGHRSARQHAQRDQPQQPRREAGADLPQRP